MYEFNQTFYCSSFLEKLFHWANLFSLDFYIKIIMDNFDEENLTSEALVQNLDGQIIHKLPH